MEYVFLTSDPVITLLILFITVTLIFLGRKLEIPYLPAIVVIYSLGFLIYHTHCIDISEFDIDPQLYFSSVIDLLMLFLGFITYLWIDNIAAKNKNLKSYGDPFSWFWEKL